MKTVFVKSFYVIGTAIRTSNEPGQAEKDIPGLWSRFLSGGLIEKIPNRINNDVYCVYTDYEKDHTKPYTTILGCKVSKLDNIPEGFIGKSISGGNCSVFTATGKIPEGVVFHEWVKIWNSGISRAYTADFEVYSEKAQNPDKAVIDIFVAVK